jgi:hypothetical protein
MIAFIIFSVLFVNKFIHDKFADLYTEVSICKTIVDAQLTNDTKKLNEFNLSFYSLEKHLMIHWLIYYFFMIMLIPTLYIFITGGFKDIWLTVLSTLTVIYLYFRVIHLTNKLKNLIISQIQF